MKPLLETQSFFLSNARDKAQSILKQLRGCYKNNEVEEYMINEIQQSHSRKNRQRQQYHTTQNYKGVIEAFGHVFWVQKGEVAKLLNISESKGVKIKFWFI